MKTKITILSLVLCSLFSGAQTVSDFEGFSAFPNTAYSPTTSTPFQTSSAVFEYEWDNSFGGFWSAGFSYTNKQDSVNGTFNNLYGVKALKGYTNSATWVVGQAYGTIKLKAPYDKVEGFYITNTTYAYKTVKNGDSFSRKFGDTTGTGSGTTIAQGSYPDYFKVTAKGFKNGSMKQDSAVFFLADYRFANNTQDYIVDTWQWFNTSSLGSVDSVQFFMYSSDESSFGMNTPAFFAMDNFTASAPNPVAIAAFNPGLSARAFPNPFHASLTITGASQQKQLTVTLKDISGKTVLSAVVSEEAQELDAAHLPAGVYLLEMSGAEGKAVQRFIKN